MNNYQIIPRKFRPKRFSEVAGHSAIVTTLKNALATQKTSQAYLFCGTRGCGKTTLARLFAKALNCRALDQDHEPCNNCQSCKEISEGKNLDVIEIDGASNRGIDDIRNLNETVGYAPQNGHYKIYIIDEVHMLTKEAFNALLKTLEEPPARVKFFFATTEPHKIPQTITSRCQRFNLKRIDEKTLVQKLAKIAKELSVEIEEKALFQIAHLSEGSLRDAESLLDQLICFGKMPITEELAREVLGLVPSKYLTDLDEAIKTQNTDRAIEIGHTLYESGHDLASVCDSLLDHYRTHLFQGKTFTKNQCLNFLETLITWQQEMLKTPFKQVHLEMLLVALVKSGRTIELDHLIERLLKLEGSLIETGSKPEPLQAPEEPVVEIYRNNLKNREFGKETAQILRSGASGIVQEQGASEDLKFAAKSTQPKTDSSSCFGITPPQPVAKEEKEPEKEKIPAYKYENLIRFAAVELEGSIKNG